MLDLDKEFKLEEEGHVRTFSSPSKLSVYFNVKLTDFSSNGTTRSKNWMFEYLGTLEL